MISSFKLRASSIFSGSLLNAVITLSLSLGFIFLLFARDKTNNIKPVNCVEKALVDATPTSGPAFVYRKKSDSLARELVGTLQMVVVDK